MAVTNPDALTFSNQRLRVNADRIAQAYYAMDNISDRWVALGGGQSAIDVMEVDIRIAADHVYNAYAFAFHTEKVWFLLGSSALIPNDAGEIIEDGAASDGRPIVNGQQAHQLMDRVVQFQNWLLSSTGNFTDVTRDSVSYLNTILKVTNEVNQTMTVGDAGNFINRCNELKTNYEATSNQNLNFVLNFAVNPQRSVF